MEGESIVTSSHNPGRGCKRGGWWCLSALPVFSILGFIIHVILIFHANDPYYSLDTIAVEDFSSVGGGVAMNITGRVLNPNNDVDFYFLEGNTLLVGTHSGFQLGRVTFGASFLAAKESAGFRVVLIPMVSQVLMDAMEMENIELNFLWKARVKLEGIAFKTPAVTRIFACLVVVDRLNGNAAILSHTCG